MVQSVRLSPIQLKAEAAAPPHVSSPPLLIHPIGPLPLSPQSATGATFELAVFDEAHYMAQRKTKAQKYSFGLDDANSRPLHKPQSSQGLRTKQASKRYSH